MNNRKEGAMSNIKVSVVIPVYKAEEYISECLDTLLNQTLKEMEFIFVDDCGGDSAIKIVEEKAKSDSRIIIIYSDVNEGQGSSRNKGIEIAHGEYLGFVDADDTLDLDFYENLYEMAKRNECDVCKGRFIKKFSDGRTEESGLCDSFEGFPEVSERNDWYSIFTNEHQSAIYLSKIIHENKIRYSKTIIEEDTTFLLDMMMYSKKVALNRETCYYYWQRENSITHDKSRSYCDEALKDFKAKLSLLNKYDIDIVPSCDFVFDRFCYLIKKYYVNLLIQFKNDVGYQETYLDEMRKSVTGFKFAEELSAKFYGNARWKNIFFALVDGKISKARELIIDLFDIDNELKISVIIPIFNAEKTLRRCLNSVLEQSLYELEVICVDDCSSDGTMAILQEYSKKDSRVKVIRNETNLKAGVSRNKGMEFAQGKYLAFLDADDYFAVDALEELYVSAHENDLDFIKSKAIALDYSTNNEVKHYLYNLDKIKENMFNVVTNYYRNPNIFEKISVVPWNGTYKKAFIKNNNIKFNDLICCNDRSFYVEVLTKAYRAMVLKYKMIYHFVNNSNSLVGKRHENFEVHFSSYHIIDSAISMLSDEMKFRILSFQLNDLAGWFDRALNRALIQKDNVNVPNIVFNTKEFFEHLDITFFEETAKKFDLNLNVKWYYRYLELKTLFKRDPMQVSFPSVSVIVTVYNEEKYLEQCIETLLQQTFTNIEVVCIDDGSTDSSLSILTRYEQKDDRIRVYSQENKGAGAARNLGLSVASGDYILFVDSNDYFEKSMLNEAVHKAIMTDSDITVFASNVLDDKTGVMKEHSWTFKTENIPVADTFSVLDIKENLFRSFTWLTWNKLYKKSFVIDNRLQFQEQRTTNDIYFVLTSFLKAEKITLLDKPLYVQRINISTSLQNTREKSWECFYYALVKVKEELILMGKYSMYRYWFINFALHICIWNLNTLEKETAKHLLKKLKTEWFKELEIMDYGSGFYEDTEDYNQFLDIMATEENWSEEDVLWKDYQINVLTRRNADLNSSGRKIKISNSEYLTEQEVAKKLRWNKEQRILLQKKLNDPERHIQIDETHSLPERILVEKLIWNREQNEKLKTKVNSLEAELKNPNRKICIGKGYFLTEKKTVEKLLWNRKRNEELEAKVKILEDEVRVLKGHLKEENKLAGSLNAEKADLEHAINATRNSVSYKIGRAVTWLPRKIRGEINK